MFDLMQGVTVIDLSTVVLGPFASQLLADYGANVIKVEPPTGDIFRDAAPSKNQGMGAGFLNLNRNKRSIALDLKQTEGRGTLYELLRDADVLLHNMRPAAAEKLGVDYATLKAINPQLIYCAAVGFGSDGPYANRPAYDDIIQSMAGFASLTKDATGDPKFIPTVLTDKITGLYAVIGILTGLVSRVRTGQGLAVEAAMFESLVSFIFAEHLSGHTFRPPVGSLGYDRLMTPYRRPYATADGYISVLPYTTKHWIRFLRMTPRAELADAEWIQDTAMRNKRIAELYAIVAETMPRWNTSRWLDELEKSDIPCGPVNSLEDLLEDPHLQAISFFQEACHPSEGPIRTVRQPLSFKDANFKPDQMAPQFGENGRHILQEYGLSEDQVQHLIDSGVIIVPDEKTTTAPEK